MEDIAEVGESVFYTGDNSHAFDIFTMNNLNTYFIIEEPYEVTEVGVRIIIGAYYKFKGFMYEYPCKSFVRNHKELTRITYGLK